LREGLRHGADIVRPAVQPLGDDAVGKAELGGDHHVIAEGRNRFANQRFVGALAVGLRRIEKGDSTLKRGADQGDAGFLVGRRAVAITQAHAA
jgi:hypothetical protein